jgi:hypothetical protein
MATSEKYDSRPAVLRPFGQNVKSLAFYFNKSSGCRVIAFHVRHAIKVHAAAYCHRRGKQAKGGSNPPASGNDVQSHRQNGYTSGKDQTRPVITQESMHRGLPLLKSPISAQLTIHICIAQLLT